MKASDLFVKCLEEENIRYIFGVPGEENADFMMSLQKSKKITFILTRHEQGAAFMAEIYGRLTGDPAGCLGTLGPGATNLLTGVGNANMDRVPMIVLTGQGSSKRLHKESHQIMDVVSMFRPLTKWATTIYHADTIPEVVRKAVRIARTEKPGAVHIELCEDTAKLTTDKQPLEVKRYDRSHASHEVICEIFTKIKKAKRPIILAGNGCVRHGDSKQLTQFAEKSGIGVLNTFMAKGCISMDSPQCLYTIGLGTKDITTCAIDAADLVISIGFDIVEYHPVLWNPNGAKSVVHIDFCPAEIDENYHPEVEAVGDVDHSLQQLNVLLDKDPFTINCQQQQGVRRDMHKVFTEHQNDSGSPIKPQKVLFDTRSVVDADGIVLSDVGAHKMWIARHYQCYLPNTCLIPNGFCSMGFALPGAIAASLVHPDRHILAISGDAGFLMNVQEMETAKRLNSKITCLVWEDNAYGLIAWKQEAEFGEHTDLAFDNPKWDLLAQSFGWNSHYVDDAAKLQDTLKQALNEDKPSLVVVPIDYRENMKLSEQLQQLTCSI